MNVEAELYFGRLIPCRQTGVKVFERDGDVLLPWTGKPLGLPLGLVAISDKHSLFNILKELIDIDTTETSMPLGSPLGL